MYVAFAGDKGIDEFVVAKKIFNDLFWKVKSREGRDTMKIYGVMIGVATLVVMLLFLIYFFFTKSYFNNLN